MGRDLNYCSFIGRLGNPVDMKYTQSGSAIANFSIACSDDYKDKNGQKVEQTNWIRIVAFGKLAEICGQYLDKGSQVFISGKQVTRKWQAQDGTDRWTTEIVANEMQMLGSNSREAGGDNASRPDNPRSGRPENGRGQEGQGGPQSDDGFDDCPF